MKCTGGFRHKLYHSAEDRFSVRQAVGIARHVDDLAVMNESVENGGGDGCVAEEVSPFIKTLV